MKGPNQTVRCWMSCLIHIRQVNLAAVLGKGGATKSNEFSEKIQTAFEPPHFGKLECSFFYNGYGRMYARRYEGQIVWNACTWFPETGTILRILVWLQEPSSKCVLLWFFSIQLLKKTYPEPWNYLQFHDQKALFKVPKICNINFWHFSKISSDLVAGPFP